MLDDDTGADQRHQQGSQGLIVGPRGVIIFIRAGLSPQHLLTQFGQCEHGARQTERADNQGGSRVEQVRVEPVSDIHKLIAVQRAT